LKDVLAVENLLKKSVLVAKVCGIALKSVRRVIGPVTEISAVLRTKIALPNRIGP